MSTVISNFQNLNHCYLKCPECDLICEINCSYNKYNELLITYYCNNGHYKKNIKIQNFIKSAITNTISEIKCNNCNNKDDINFLNVINATNVSVLNVLIQKSIK